MMGEIARFFLFLFVCGDSLGISFHRRKTSINLLTTFCITNVYVTYSITYDSSVMRRVLCVWQSYSILTTVTGRVIGHRFSRSAPRTLSPMNRDSDRIKFGPLTLCKQIYVYICFNILIIYYFLYKYFQVERFSVEH